MNRLSVIIQAGGESRRMGANKALLRLRGESLIQRAVRLAQAAAPDELLITANRPEVLDFLGLPILVDLLPGRGALGGLYTALHGARCPLAAVVACDMPFLSAALIRVEVELLERLNVDAVLPSSPQGIEPLHAVYRRAVCLPAVRTALEAGDQRLISWLPHVKAYVMEWTDVLRYDPLGRAFFNINTPADLEAAEQLAGESSQTAVE